MRFRHFSCLDAWTFFNVITRKDYFKSTQYCGCLSLKKFTQAFNSFKGLLIKSSKWTMLQGVSSDMFFFWMALRGRKNENFDNISLAAWSRVLLIYVSSTSFQKSSIDWPQQPPTERVSNISEKLDFCWSILWKGTSIDHFGAGNDPSIRISKVFDEMRLSRSLSCIYIGITCHKISTLVQ